MPGFSIRGLLFLLCMIALPSCAHKSFITVKRIEFPEVEPLPQVRQPARDARAKPTELFAGKRLERGFAKPDSASREEDYHIMPASSETAIQSPLKKLISPTESNKDQPGENLSRSDSKKKLTLSDLEQMALETNPTLAQAAAVVDKARGIREQVSLYPNPVIGYSAEEVGDSGTAGKQGAFVSQTIVTGRKLQLNRAVAGWNVEGLSWEYQAQRYRVLNDVQIRFYETLGAQRRVQLATELVKVAEEGVKVAKALFEAKQGARPDILQAQVELNQVRMIIQNAHYKYESDWKQLAGFVGQVDLEPVELVGKLQSEPKEWSWQTTYEDLLSNSPELQVALTRVQRAQTQIHRQEAQPIPNFLAGVGVAHDNASGDNIANVNFGIPLPIYNRNQGNIAIAQAEYQRAVRDVERLRLNLRNRLASAFRDFQQAAQQVQRYQQDILPSARENLKLTEEGYKQGEFDFLRVLTARRTYFETNLRSVDSQIALRQADVILSGLLLRGGLNDTVNPGVGAGVLGGVGQRGQALGGQ